MRSTGAACVVKRPRRVDCRCHDNRLNSPLHTGILTLPTASRAYGHQFILMNNMRRVCLA